MANILDQAGEAFATPTADAYKPKHLPQGQIMQESGGKQFGKNGKPLTSKAGAIGIAQVMPGTAPEAAKLAGLPYDDWKYRNDKDYNLALGDAYQGHMNQMFKGNPLAAKAAYNAGPGAVRKAIRLGGSNWVAHLPPETQEYIGMAGGTSANRVPQKGDVRAVDVPGSRFQGESSRPVDRSAPVANPTEMAGRAGAQAQGVMAASDGIGGILGEVQAGLKANMAEQTATLEKSIAAKQVIRDEQRQTTERIKGELLPIFAKRKAIADRMVEVSNMDPFSRAIAGVFNPNFSEKYLSQQDRLLQQQEEVVADEFNKTNTLQNALLDSMNSEFTDKSALQQLSAKNMAMTLSMAQDSLNVAQAQMDSTVGIIRANGAAAAAIEGQRADVLGGITDTGSISTLLAQAKAKGGKVMVGGVEISEGDLVSRGMAIETQGLQMKQLQLAVASGDQQMIQFNQERMVESMTPKERQVLAANNGRLPDGTQISTEILTPALARDAQNAEMVVQNTITQQVGGSAKAVTQQWSNEFKLVSGKAGALFGGRATSGLSRNVNQQSLALEQAVAQLNRMPDGPAKDQMKARVTTMTSGFIETNRKELDAIIQGTTKDKEVQALYRAYLTGQPVAPDQAARGFINAVRGGNPLPGVSADDLANPAISMMTAAVQRVYAANGGQAGVQARLNNKQTKAQMELSLTQAVNSAAQRGWVDGVSKQMLGSLSGWAQADKHPAGNISRATLLQAEQKGDAEGYKRAASLSQKELGVALNPEQVRQVLAGQKVGNLQLNPDQITSLSRKLATLQTQEMLRALDAGWTQGKGVRPSVALGDYMNSDKFQSRVSTIERNVGGTSMGALVASSIAGQGSVSKSMSDYARAVAANSQVNEEQDYDAALTQYKAYRQDPFARSAAILGSIEGVDPQSEAKVVAFLRSKASVGMIGDALHTVAEYTSFDNANDDRVYNKAITPSIDNLIMNQKWPDDLEPLRKKIAPLWQKHGQLVDNAMRGLESK